MSNASKVLNAIVCLLLLLFGIVVAIFSENPTEGAVFFGLMAASALFHFLSKRIRFMLVFEGLSVIAIILAVMSML